MKMLALDWPRVGADRGGLTVVEMLPYNEGDASPPDPVVGSVPVLTLVLDQDTATLLSSLDKCSFRRGYFFLSGVIRDHYLCS